MLLLFHSAQNLVPKAEVMTLLDESIRVLSAESNVLEVTINKECHQEQTINPSETFTVVGDTHGQYYDLLNLLRLNGDPTSDNKYLFNGDFVDRGSFSFQVVFLLLAYKTLFPENVYLLRGNHETIDMNVMYGFFHEILTKYDNDVLRKFWTVFSYLPLACVFKNAVHPNFRTLILHGGLFSRENVTLDELNSLDRTVALDVPSELVENDEHVGLMQEDIWAASIMNDLLWADPMRSRGRKQNRARGGGLLFGPDVTNEFLKQNDLNLLIRSHQVRQNGWSSEHNGKCLTVFSAPNYCDSSGNKGAYLKFTNDNTHPEKYEFKAVPHPPLGPMAHLQMYRATANM